MERSEYIGTNAFQLAWTNDPYNGQFPHPNRRIFDLLYNACKALKDSPDVEKESSAEINPKTGKTFTKHSFTWNSEIKNNLEFHASMLCVKDLLKNKKNSASLTLKAPITVNNGNHSSTEEFTLSELASYIKPSYPQVAEVVSSFIEERQQKPSVKSKIVDRFKNNFTPKKPDVENTRWDLRY